MNEELFFKYLKELLAIDSVTGQYREIQKYLRDTLTEMGYAPAALHKGGVLCELGGEGHPLVLSAHADTIGLMVRHINDDGTVKVCAVGGLHAFHCEQENVRIHTRKNGVITGTVRRKESSVHVTQDEKWDEVADYEKNVGIVLDADVHTAEDVRALGIEVGDYIALETHFAYENGYIKTRFIDDKALLAILLTAAKRMKETGEVPPRKVYLLLAMYEEIGHGGSYLPADTEDFIALDIACTGPYQTTDERKVTVFCKDSRFPYHIDIVEELRTLAEEAEADFVMDIFTPHYGTDADPALVAGYDIRHGAFGPGVLSSHGYERTHIDGIKNTYRLLEEVLRHKAP